MRHCKGIQSLSLSQPLPCLSCPLFCYHITANASVLNKLCDAVLCTADRHCAKAALQSPPSGEQCALAKRLHCSHNLALLELVHPCAIAFGADLHRCSAGPLRSAGAAEKLAGCGRSKCGCERSHRAHLMAFSYKCSGSCSEKRNNAPCTFRPRMYG